MRDAGFDHYYVESFPIILMKQASRLLDQSLQISVSRQDRASNPKLWVASCEFFYKRFACQDCEHAACVF